MCTESGANYSTSYPFSSFGSFGPSFHIWFPRHLFAIDKIFWNYDSLVLFYVVPKSFWYLEVYGTKSLLKPMSIGKELSSFGDSFLI